MSVSEQPSAAAAAVALRTYRQARGAAVGPRPTPAWYPPARGLLAAATYAGAPTLFAPHPAGWQLLAVLVSALAFLAVHAAAVRPGGVLVLPRDDPRRRAKLRAQLASLPVWGLGWLAAVPFGLVAGAIASGVLLGGFIWWSSEHERRLAVRR